MLAIEGLFSSLAAGAARQLHAACRGTARTNGRAAETGKNAKIARKTSIVETGRRQPTRNLP